MSDSILEVIYETSKGFNKAGVMDNKTMRKIKELCLPEIKKYTPEQIKKIRLKNKASQAVFAQYLNLTTSTIQKWEIGEKKPSGASLKLLNIVEKKGLEVLL